MAVCCFAWALACDCGQVVIFITKNISRIVLKGAFLVARNIWGNPYLNSTTVLFDMQILKIHVWWVEPGD